MSVHADAGPSAAHGWIACPAYVTRARGKTGSSSSFARDGTAKHHVSECILTGKPVPKTVTVDGVEIEVTDEMLEHVNVYVNYAQMVTYGADYIGVEKRVVLKLAGIKEPVFGTCDLVHFNSLWEEIEVTDAKFGGGKKVEAQNNPQLRIYALAALQLPELKKAKVKKVRLGIVQPAMSPPVKTEELSIDELYAWRDEVLIPALQRIDADDGTENPGSHCHWCRRKAECGAMRSKALDKARLAFADEPPAVETLKEPEISDILEEVEIVETWIAAVREEAQRRIEAGEKVRGWRLAPTRPTRKWKDETAAYDHLRAEFDLHPDFLRQTPKLLSPAQMEKLLKKTGYDPALLDPLISSESSGVKLVRSDEPTVGESFAD